jgi:hypothetical protein
MAETVLSTTSDTTADGSAANSDQQALAWQDMAEVPATLAPVVAGGYEDILDGGRFGGSDAADTWLLTDHSRKRARGLGGGEAKRV